MGSILKLFGHFLKTKDFFQVSNLFLGGFHVLPFVLEGALLLNDIDRLNISAGIALFFSKSLMASTILCIGSNQIVIGIPALEIHGFEGVFNAVNHNKRPLIGQICCPFVIGQFFSPLFAPGQIGAQQFNRIVDVSGNSSIPLLGKYFSVRLAADPEVISQAL